MEHQRPSGRPRDPVADRPAASIPAGRRPLRGFFALIAFIAFTFIAFTFIAFTALVGLPGSLLAHPRGQTSPEAAPGPTPPPRTVARSSNPTDSEGAPSTASAPRPDGTPRPDGAPDSAGASQPATADEPAGFVKLSLEATYPIALMAELSLGRWASLTGGVQTGYLGGRSYLVDGALRFSVYLTRDAPAGPWLALQLSTGYLRGREGKQPDYGVDPVTDYWITRLQALVGYTWVTRWRFTFGMFVGVQGIYYARWIPGGVEWNVLPVIAGGLSFGYVFWRSP